MDYINPFESYSLSVEWVIVIAITCFIVLSNIYAVSTSFYRSYELRKHFISLIYSVCVSSASIYYLNLKYIDILSVIHKTHKEPISFFHGNSDISVAVCIFIACTSLFSIITAFFETKKFKLPSGALQLLTVFIVLVACSGNAMWIKTRPFSTAFLISGIEEIPTAMKMLGLLVPLFKSDVLYGVTTLIFRMIYHAFLLIYALHLKVDSPLVMILAFNFVSQALSFNAWVSPFIEKIMVERIKKSAKKRAEKNS